jgi:hypothetical protein
MEEAMLGSFADTITTCTLYVNQDVSEDSLYTLVNSGYSPLQKAAYFMLKHLYDNYIPRILFTKDEDKEIV